MVTLTPLPSLRVSRFHLPAFSGFPNTSLSPHPLYIYHAAFPAINAGAVSAHLRQVGVVEPQWTYPMYRQHHFHSTTHEVLVVLSGAARLCFGGSVENPDKVEQRVEAGDVMVLPAGVGHAMLQDEGGFMMLGCYPRVAEQWDHCTGNEGKVAEGRIRALKWFDRDPVYGDEGPVLQ